MFKKIKTILFDLDSTRALLSLHFSGYLKDMGWFNSYKNRKPLNSENKPIPWLTYPSISFIENRLKKEFDLFEFGSGHSTLYFAERVNTVTSVEHDESWYREIKLSIPPNVNLIYQELEYDGAYCRMTQHSHKQYDVIIVDGRDRVNCVRYSIESLKKNGVIILDNSERVEYKEIYDIMEMNNFRCIEFWGIVPGIFDTSSTTIFYQPNNCLGI